ncbi:MAG: hypothetical protein R6U08_09905 [Bacillota bacterium]
MSKRKLLIILKINLRRVLQRDDNLINELFYHGQGVGPVEASNHSKPYLPLVINGIMPVVAGGLIYIIWRDKSIVMFQWFDAIHMSGITAVLRKISIQPPDWVIYSAPAGLWAYSFNFSLLYIWHDAECKIKYIWMILVPVAAVGLELGQLLGFVAGTFDIVDIIHYLIFIGLSFLAIKMTTVNRIKT